jgi:hypothetical protein
VTSLQLWLVIEDMVKLFITHVEVWPVLVARFPWIFETPEIIREFTKCWII